VGSCDRSTGGEVHRLDRRARVARQLTLKKAGVIPPHDDLERAYRVPATPERPRSTTIVRRRALRELWRERLRWYLAVAVLLVGGYFLLGLLMQREMAATERYTRQTGTSWEQSSP
jgi:hypothetical protein